MATEYNLLARQLRVDLRHIHPRFLLISFMIYLPIYMITHSKRCLTIFRRKEMNKKIIIALLTLAIVNVGSLKAESMYYGAGAAFLDFSDNEISDSASLNAIFGRLGMQFNENIAAELRLGIGIGDDTLDIFGFDATVELDTLYGFYLKGGVPVSDAFYPYAVLGYSRGEATASVPGFGSDSSSESDFSYGLGVDFIVTDYVSVNLEYMNYLDKDGSEIDGFAIGFTVKY